MPRNGSGSYSLPTGNPVVTGTTIEASWANTTLSDIGNELTNSLSRTGAGGMTGAFRAADGSSTLPGIAWGSETSTGFYRATTSDMRAVVATGLIQKWTAAGSEFNSNVNIPANGRVGYLAQSDTSTVAGVTIPNYGLGVGVFTGFTNPGVWLGGYDGLLLGTNGAERMRINSAGNVGIGATPSAWGNEFVALEFGGTGASVSSYKSAPTAAEWAYFTSNAYNDNTNWKFIRDGRAANYSLNDGKHVWYTSSASGSIGGNVTFNQVMEIDTAGNVGVGVASPQAKLDVGGDYREKVNTANTGTAYTINLSDGTIQILTLTGNCTFTFPTATAGKSFMILLKQDGTGSRTVTWPASVKWPGASAPTVTSTASKLDKYVFTADGTNWYGSNGGQNYTV